MASVALPSNKAAAKPIRDGKNNRQAPVVPRRSATALAGSSPPSGPFWLVSRRGNLLWQAVGPGVARQRLGGDLLRRRLAGGRSESALNVIDDDLLEISGQRRAAKRHGLFAVDKNRRGRLFAGTRQRNADIGMFGLARPVDDAAHHRDVETLDARITRLPFRHRVADEALDAGGELLKCRRGRAAAAGAGRDQRHECAQAQSLQQFLSDLYLERTIAIRLRSERNANRVANALLKQDADCRRRCHDAL